jgi:dCTP deaminase
MSILSDQEIIELVERDGIIKPFSAELRSHKFGRKISDNEEAMLYTANPVISHGLSSYGYDVMVADHYLIYHNALATYIDPKAFDEKSFIEVSGKGYAFIPPNSFALAETVEYIKVPRDCLVMVAAKSSIARCGLVTNATMLEPGWEGTVTLELSNTTPLPIKVYSNEGICQLVFMRADKPCIISYADRKGKYQNQRGITLPKI